MKLISLHQRLVDIVQQADTDEKLSWADLVSIANHLVEAGVTLDDAEEGIACGCGCDDEVEEEPTWEEMSHWLANVPPVQGSR